MSCRGHGDESFDHTSLGHGLRPESTHRAVLWLGELPHGWNLAEAARVERVYSFTKLPFPVLCDWGGMLASFMDTIVVASCDVIKEWTDEKHVASFWVLLDFPNHLPSRSNFCHRGWLLWIHQPLAAEHGGRWSFERERGQAQRVLRDFGHDSFHGGLFLCGPDALSREV